MSDTPGQAAAASLLERARAERDDLAARMLLAAAVQQVALSVGARSILTGGTAVDFYASKALGTSEGYPNKWRPSADVDLVVMSVEGRASVRKDLLAGLVALGMRPRWFGDTARMVDVPDFPFLLEIVGDELNRDPKAERVITVLVDGKWPVTLRGPEDVILSYGESGWDTYHHGDWERALAVYAAMKDRLDVPFLHEEAARRKKTQILESIVRMEPLRRRGYP